MQFLREKVASEAKQEMSYITDKSRVFDHVTKYIMYKLHSRYGLPFVIHRIFPRTPSAVDAQLAKKIELLQGVKMSELGMKIENIHDEVWMLACKSKAKERIL